MKKKLAPLQKSLLAQVCLCFILAGFIFSLTGSVGIPKVEAAVLPAYQWHTFFGSAAGDDAGYKVAKDGLGNIYIAGSSNTGWNGPGDEPPKHSYSGAQDILILKLNSAGAYQWHTFYGSVSGNDTASSLAIDNNGNIYVAGESFNAGWLGDGNTNPINNFTFGREIMVLKLNSDGVYQWHTFHGTSNYDSAYGIVVDNQGNSYVAGYSNENWGSPLHAHNPDPGVPRQDIVVLKLNSAGMLQWNTFWGSSVPAQWGDVAEGVDYAYGIARDNAGNLYVTGISYNTWQGGNSNNISPLHPHSFAGGGPTFLGNYDIVVLKLNSDGAYQWHTFYGAPDQPRSFYYEGDYANIPSCDGSGNLYVSGYSFQSWQGDGDTPPLHAHSGNYDIMILKLNSDGAYQWHTFYGSAQADYGYGPVTDGRGNYYLAVSSTASWQGDNNTDPLHPHSGNFDLGVLKLSSAGAYQWHIFYGSNQNDQGYGLVLDENQDLIAVGVSNATWLGDGNVSPLHNHSGGSEVVALKLRLQAMLYLPIILKN